MNLVQISLTQRCVVLFVSGTIMFYLSVSPQSYNTDQLVNQLMLDGKLMTDGTVIARFKSDLLDNFTIKTTAQVPHVCSSVLNSLFLSITALCLSFFSAS